MAAPKKGAGKIVVMLSSVAKPPPAGTQALSQVPPLADSTPKALIPPKTVLRPPPLPPKQVTPLSHIPPQTQLNTTTYVKLPPKTAAPKLTLISSAPRADSTPGNAAPPSLPKKSGPQHIPPIKLNESLSDKNSPAESIFLDSTDSAPAPASTPEPRPEGWKSLQPGELNPPGGGLQSLEVFARSQPEPEAKDKPLVAPPLRPPSGVESPGLAGKGGPTLLPPPLPPPLPPSAESPATPPSAIQVAPPLIEKEPESPSEKLPPPLLPAEARQEEPTLPAAPEPPPLHKVPAMIQPELSASGPQLQPKPLKSQPLSTTARVNWLKQSTPLVLSSTSPKALPKIAEAKPALKPAVLPKRLAATPEEPPAEMPAIETGKAPVETTDDPSPAIQPREADSSAPSPSPEPAAQEPSPGENTRAVAETVAASPAVPFVKATHAIGPALATRADRTRKRRLRGTIFFWCILIPLTFVVLFFGSLHFGRDTRMEGQVIPPTGMLLNNEVWIVSGGDLWSQASGLAEDLAKERSPVRQDIQERQDHVHRAQADVAAREERIRLIQQEIQSSKDEASTIIKQSRDATQQIWDGEGARIDDEYQSRFDQLRKAIAARAKSLNLKYQPDDAYPSPEVWANAYRLALYQVPAGVDSAKELQWLGDQMKQWRDFLKTLDDRKEQLREKAAQLKLAPGPKLTDLNAKITELQQRIDSTQAEEVPLKAELQQAQADLAQSETTDAGLDDRFYTQLYSLPQGAILNHLRIPLERNGRFTWVDTDTFGEGEKVRHYWIFARATRQDGRQYWALGRVSLEKDHKLCILMEPDSFVSTKAILRPDLPPEEQEQ